MTGQKPPFRNPPPYDMTESLCTCGKRPKHKCCEENEHKIGKMCLKGYDTQPVTLKGLSEATEDLMSKVDRDIRQLRKELEEELEKYGRIKQK